MLAALLATPALVSALPPVKPIVVNIPQSVINKHPQITKIPSCLIAHDPKDYCPQDYSRDTYFYELMNYVQFRNDIALLRELKQCQALNHPRLREACDPRSRPVKQATSKPGKTQANGYYESRAKTQKTVRRRETAKTRDTRYSRHQAELIGACQNLGNPFDRAKCNAKIGNCEALGNPFDRESCINEKVESYTAEKTRHDYDDHRARKEELVGDCQSLSNPFDRAKCNTKIGNCEALGNPFDRESCINEKVESYTTEKTREKTRRKTRNDAARVKELVGDCESLSNPFDKERCLKKVVGLE
jgi:hypothetical protein